MGAPNLSQEWCERFVRIWQAASTVPEVAEAMGVTVRRATFTAKYMRQRGVPLKKFPARRGPFVDWKALAAGVR